MLQLNFNEMASIKDSRCSLNLFRYLKNFSKKFKKVYVEPYLFFTSLPML